VLVIEANYTRRSSAQKAKELLHAANVRVLGTILSGRTFPIPDGIYRRL
jgi:Mrp family chromosome partitioning ATPase